MKIETFINTYPQVNEKIKSLNLCVEISSSDIIKMRTDDLYTEYIIKKYLRESENSFKSFIKDITKEK